MADMTRDPAGFNMPATSPSNGVVTGPSGIVGGKRKKQKRRAKLAARQAADGPAQQSHGYPTDTNSRSDHAPNSQSNLQDPISYRHSAEPQPGYGEQNYDEHGNFDPQGQSEDAYYSDDDTYDDHYDPTVTSSNGAYRNDSPPAPGAKRKSPSKRRSASIPQSLPYNGHSAGSASLLASAMSQASRSGRPPPTLSSATLQTLRRKDRIWNSSAETERENIKEFWLGLNEEERKSLLKVEKEAVLKQMKDQQKHSCSCTVCGRKRTAIEEELEVLYDAYYQELEHFANRQHDVVNGDMPPPSGFRRHSTQDHPNTPVPLPLNAGKSRPGESRVHELLDDEDDFVSDDDDDYSDEDEEDYSDEEAEEMYRDPSTDFLNFGQSLTVQGGLSIKGLMARFIEKLNFSGGILTVADDMLKNDGKKFLEMMTQLAERRMAREQEVEYATTHPHSQPLNHHGGPPQEPPLDDEYDDEDDEDYDSQEQDYDDEEEEDDMGGMTEEQRMEEGRRMFQIFAARMFEQRVLTAYKEKKAAERQKKLLEELENESLLGQQREAKKARDAEKKRLKKQQQKQAKAEEKAKREQEKLEQEAAARAVEEKKLEEQRQKREEQRKKKDAERKLQEEERQRKEAERIKRQQEERERQQDADRKLREQKAQEKKQRDEAKKKERDE
ncbi:hypothetical protein LTR28_005726, partial [Elasticomyces elasticus]